MGKSVEEHRGKGKASAVLSTAAEQLDVVIRLGYIGLANKARPPLA